jgi:large subunit ribosomal protein L22
MPAPTRTNERPGTRAQVRYARMSAYKAREVLDLIRGREVADADELLQFVERDAAIVIRKCLESAMANAAHNDEIDPEDLYVSACFADEGPTLKRWRPRARGRATRIRKRTCHITVIVSRLTENQLEARRRRDAAEARRARVAKSRGAQPPAAEEQPKAEVVEVEDAEAESEEPEADVEESAEAEDVEVEEPEAESEEPEADVEESAEAEDATAEAAADEADTGETSEDTEGKDS